jgi:hypothetical protein
VTLKVSKVRAVLPSRKAATASKISARSCEAKVTSSKKKKLLGPLLPNGKFLSSREKFVSDELCVPTKSDYTNLSNRGGNWEPVFLDLRVLRDSERRKLSKNPGSGFKRKLGNGETKVYPVPNCVRDYHRRSHALYELRKALPFVASLDPDAQLLSITSLIGLLPEIFRCRPSFSKAYSNLRKQLFYFKRKAAEDRNQDQRSRREALTEQRIDDLFSSESS